MRNLSLSSVDVVALAEGGICSTAVDLDENVFYIASEKGVSDGATNVEIYRIDKNFVVRFVFDLVAECLES